VKFEYGSNSNFKFICIISINENLSILLLNQFGPDPDQNSAHHKKNYGDFDLVKPSALKVVQSIAELPTMY
jgi:hypothetical protein